MRRECLLGIALGIALSTMVSLSGAARADTPPATATATAATVKQLMIKELAGVAGKEVLVSTVTYPPGGSSPPHRHDAQVFVYVLQGELLMQVQGGPKVSLKPGDTFYESPTDVHSVSANASQTAPATFVVFIVKDKGKATTRPAAP
jgi:quercetin dioxygenase-like cupin family protein